MKLTTLAVITYLAVCLVLPGITHAAVTPKNITEVADPAVRAVIEAEFDGSRGSLEVDKKNFGMHQHESAQELGEGIPYWTVVQEESLQFSGYVFPILASGRQVGVVFTEQSDGKWQIFNIKNNDTLTRDLEYAKKNLTEMNQARLIYDQAYGLYALETELTTGEPVVLPLRDHLSLNMQKHKLISIDEFNKKVKQLNDERSASPKNSKGAIHTGGASVGDQTVDRALGYDSAWLIGVAALALLTAIYMYKKRTIRRTS
ncbi:hypothetical protein ACFO9Q_19900 [Paenibacillus sp. GCM10023252]|uniref:hypothetical protein n=1 Tax=Paenibacillus sp. GCM10023252 TaxID=3252649 RepID=UPI00360E5D38